MRSLNTRQKRHYRPGRLICSGEWLNYRENVRNIEQALAQFAGGRLLDVGCGARPFECRKDQIEWIGLDIEGNSFADFHGTVLDLPFADKSFDCVLATQVLEHIEEPKTAMSECARVLREDGLLILSVPQYWELHEIPYDYFRYTEFGLLKLCAESGFDVLNIRREATGFALVGLAINNIINEFGGRPTSFVWKAFKAPMYLFVNIACLALAQVFKNDRDVQGYTLLARKNASAHPQEQNVGHQ